MCRYGLAMYKGHFACFNCRKTFKKPHYYELPEDKRPEKKEDLVYFCPQCRGEIHSMGMDFRSPKTEDFKQWKKVEILYQYGFTFHSCGCGVGLRPAELKQVEEFLKNNLKKSEGEKLLNLIAQKRRLKK